MKSNPWLFLAAAVSASLFTCQLLADTPPPVVAPAPDTNAPAPAPILTPVAAPAPAAELVLSPAPAPEAKPAKLVAMKKTATKPKTARRPAAPEPTMPLNPGPAVVTVHSVNVRGKPTINSEVIKRLTNGEPVTVIEEIRRNNKQSDDPDVWAKIAFPAGERAWVHASFVDAATKTVTAKKLNVRSGPGENYSSIGMLYKGDVVNQIEAKDNWLGIEPPTNACAFVAAAYLKQELPVATTVEQPTPLVPTETTQVTETPAVEPPPPEAPAVAPAGAPAGELATVAPAEPRIVQREGVVRSTWSIQAPTPYRLVNPETGRTVNYLYTTSTNLDLSRYKGLRIIVTGEEGLDERWKNTPLITISKIQVVE
jgi:uncharacterized protein YgiM (DUF1202 family)